MGMNTPFRRVVLVILALLGLYVGIWATFFPEAFFTSFPGFGLHWIALSGPYDEHLIRDVGAMYLALTAITIAAALAASAAPGRLAGLAWTVFGAIHFAFHVSHLEGGVVDRVGNIVTLGLSLALGIVLLLRGADRTEPGR
jgi:hypothetical protein